MRLLISVLGFCVLTIWQKNILGDTNTDWIGFWFSITMVFFGYLDYKEVSK